MAPRATSVCSQWAHSSWDGQNGVERVYPGEWELRRPKISDVPGFPHFLLRLLLWVYSPPWPLAPCDASSPGPPFPPTLLLVLTGWAKLGTPVSPELIKLTAAPGLCLEKRLELGGSSRFASDRPPMPFLVSEFCCCLHQGSAVPCFPVLWYLF